MSKRPRRELRVSNPFGPASTAQAPPADGTFAEEKHIEEANPSIDQPIPVPAIIIANPPLEKATEAKSVEPSAAQQDKKKAKFESLRQKYLKKTADIGTKHIQENTPSAEPAAEKKEVITPPKEDSIVPSSVILEQAVPLQGQESMPKSQIMVRSEPKSEVVEPATYKTNFQSIIEDARREPQTKQELPQPIERAPFDLKATYRPSIPIRQAKKNMSTPEPPQAVLNAVVDSPPETTVAHRPVDLSQLKHVDQNLLTANPSELLAQIHRYGYIPEITYEYLCQYVLGSKYQPPQQTSIQYRSDNRSMQPWVRTLFQKFVLESESIAARDSEIVWEFLTEFFPPLGEHLSTIFTVVMVKLSPVWYKQYERELVMSCLHYLKIIREHSTFVQLKKREQFASYLLGSLNKYLKGNEYCQLFVHLCSEFPSILKDEHLAEFDKECKQFEWAACVYLLLSKYPNRPAGKGILNNLIHIVSSLQEKGLLEQCLTVLDGASMMVGPSAYQVMRELRSRVIAKLEVRQAEAKKNSKGGIFGFFNQALEKISNSIPGKDQQSQATANPSTSKSRIRQQPSS